MQLNKILVTDDKYISEKNILKTILHFVRHPVYILFHAFQVQINIITTKYFVIQHIKLIICNKTNDCKSHFQHLFSHSCVWYARKQAPSRHRYTRQVAQPKLVSTWRPRPVKILAREHRRHTLLQPKNFTRGWPATMLSAMTRSISRLSTTGATRLALKTCPSHKSCMSFNLNAFRAKSRGVVRQLDPMAE